MAEVEIVDAHAATEGEQALAAAAYRCDQDLQLFANHAFDSPGGQYGEVSLAGLHAIFDAMNLHPSDVFCDIGCGAFRPSIAAALLRNTRGAYGVEIDSYRFAAGNRVLAHALRGASADDSEKLMRTAIVHADAKLMGHFAPCTAIFQFDFSWHTQDVLLPILVNVANTNTLKTFASCRLTPALLHQLAAEHPSLHRLCYKTSVSIRMTKSGEGHSFYIYTLQRVRGAAQPSAFLTVAMEPEEYACDLIATALAAERAASPTHRRAADAALARMIAAQENQS